MKSVMRTSNAVYTTPLGQKLGDGFMFLFRVLLGAPALAFLYLVLAFVAWRVFGGPGQMAFEQVQKILVAVYGTALALAFPAVLWIACRAVQWRVELHDGHLLLARAGISKKVSWEDVLFLRLGALSGRLSGKEEKPRNLPVLIEYRSRGTFTIWLESREAERLFKGLLERCPRAAAVDQDGTQYAPRSDRQGKGMGRLSRERIIRGGGALVAGLLVVIIALTPGNPAAGSGDALDILRRELIRLLVILQSLPLIGYGLGVLSRRAQKRKDG